ncbi:hypothetical protein [Mycobacterium szulgai]|uniref:Uncharacterized protein n=1 Tax=Mycobacterium szulgai TaxID=1787 RepID=A0A1X2DKY3_MYCSZ|nr:hypothetical protein [Mycobacterium szulgai]MCV7076714.1 hypothetical protein [Mycobacterium szulgai]ORW88791.1 hypothetical protein AWC27_13915 [Mycobacterium szulgai]
MKAKTTSDTEVTKVVLRVQERDGVCTPAAFVAEAADPASPIHDLFDWDDTSAAHRWREYQARVIIGQVRIEVNGSRAPAHVHVTVTRGDGQRKQGYVPLETALGDDELRAQVFAEARAGLGGWRNRLAAFNQAAQAVTAIDQAMIALADEEV